MILFRCVPSGYPFLWEDGSEQPAGRWHRAGAGPAQYLADTPDGAWAEVLRHLEITDPIDLTGLRETIWAVEVPDDVRPAAPELEAAMLTGGLDSYAACQAESERLRARGARAIVAPSAALRGGEARGWRVADGTRRGPPRDGRVFVLFDPRPDLVAWHAAVEARPDPALLAKVRHFADRRRPRGAGTRSQRP